MSGALLALALGSALPDCRDLRGPEVGEPEAREPTVGTARWTARGALRVWQVLVAPADGARCNFYPSCSAYALEAVQTQGLLVGAVMAAERMQRPHSGWQYSLCVAGDRRFHVDLPADHLPPGRR